MGRGLFVPRWGPGATNDLSGRRFDRLLVLGVARVHRGRKVWECQCWCNRLVEVSGKHLTERQTRSCGQCGSKGRPWSEEALQTVTRWLELKERGWTSGAIARLDGVSAAFVCNRIKRFQDRLARETKVWHPAPKEEPC